MLQSRRGFLIGAGSLLTAAFVSDARSFIRRTSQPLLASPAEVAQTMYWYELDGEEGYTYTLSLGEWTMEPPPAPTGRASRSTLPGCTRSSGFTSFTALGRSTTTSPYLIATGMIAGNVRTIRVLRRSACSAGSTLDPSLGLLAAPFWNFMKATIIPAATTFGSTQRTNYRCLCCRPVSSTSRCQSR